MIRAVFYSFEILLIFSGLILVEYTWIYEFQYFQVGAFVAITFCFLIDLILNMVAFGVTCTLKDSEFAIEAFLQVCGWILSLLFLVETLKDKLALQEQMIDAMTLGLIIRNIRILNYMLELKDFRMIVETFKKFSSPFASMMLTLYVIMFIYAIIG